MAYPLLPVATALTGVTYIGVPHIPRPDKHIHKVNNSNKLNEDDNDDLDDSAATTKRRRWHVLEHLFACTTVQCTLGL